MNFKNFFDIYCSDADGENLYLNRFIRFFSDEAAIVEAIESAELKGFFSAPSLLNEEGVADCKLSHYGRHNILAFADGPECFFVAQSHSFVYAIFLPIKELVVTNEKRESKRKNLVKDFQEACSAFLSTSLEEGAKYLGLVNGYGRPYHYFYDRVVNLHRYLEHGASKVLDVGGAAFLSGDSLGASEVFNVPSLSDINDHAPYLCIVPGHPLKRGRKEKKKLCGEFDKWIVEKLKRDCESADELYVWIGLCQEKRHVAGFEEAIRKFIVEVSVRYPSVVFLFDGLTRPVEVGEESFIIEKCQDEVSLRDSILTGLKGVKWKSMIGKEASEKIMFASKTTLFLSSALTDSMWCARFFKVPGICWSGDRIDLVLKEHIHINTWFLNEGSGFSVTGGEYSNESFYLDADYFYRTSMAGLEFSLEAPRNFVEKMDYFLRDKL
uniref:hypothetical protein n=1 Tax=uncultured Halomonas sp. TaxID=173971 RepID=UPI0026331F94|nr:hypothetical protein [uncultured Halomonas sp.]